MAPRRFSGARRVNLGDANDRGRLRLDALASFLQDIASDDISRANFPAGYGWVLRRTSHRINRLPAIYEQIELETWCSGTGKRWLERSTSISRNVGTAFVQTASIWVYVNLETGAPALLPPEYMAVFGESAAGRKVTARLTHDAPPPDDPRVVWSLRSTDFDVYGHVNNCSYWSAVEGVLASRVGSERIVAAELEFRGGILPGELPDLVVVDRPAGVAIWFEVAGMVRASGTVDLV